MTSFLPPIKESKLQEWVAASDAAEFALLDNFGCKGRAR